MRRDRPPKAAMLTAQRIMMDVIAGRLGTDHDPLPEHAMLAKYGVGRGTLREALRLLEFHGVVAIRHGPRGGPVLREPDGRHLAGVLALLLQLKDAPLRNVVEVRAAVEPVVCRLAAERMDATALSELGRTVDGMRAGIDDVPAFRAANLRFHDLIAWSSGNPLFGYMVDSLLGIVTDAVAGIRHRRDRRMELVAGHHAIYEALRSQDPVTAATRMREHIAQYAAEIDQADPKALDRVVRWDGPV